MTTLRLSIETQRTYLSGGRNEFDAYLAFYGSWPDARYTQTTPVISKKTYAFDLGELVVPTTPELRGANLWLQQFSHTHESGIPQIDAKEGAVHARAVKSGSAKIDLAWAVRETQRQGQKACCVPLLAVDHMLFLEGIRRGILHAAAGDAEILGDPLTRLGERRIEEIQQLSVDFGRKGEYVLRLEMIVPLPASISSPGTPRAHLADLLVHQIQHGMGKLDDAYWCAGMDIPPPNGVSVAGIRFPANEKDPLVRDLGLSGFDSPTGRLPAMLHVMELPLNPGEFRLDHLELCVLNALAAKSMSIGDYIAIVQEQHSAKRHTDPHRTGAYDGVLEVVASMHTATANAIDYTSDMRFPNLAALKRMTNEMRAVYSPETKDVDWSKVDPSTYTQEYGTQTTPTGTVLRTATFLGAKMRIGGLRFAWLSGATGKKMRARHPEHHHQELHHARHPPLVFMGATNDQAQTPAPKNLAQLSLVNGESWDREQLSMCTHCADCEDVAGVCVRNADRTTNELNRHVGQLNPLLEATRLVHNILVPALGAASVSEPYVSTEKGQKPLQHPDLPNFGEEAKAQWKEGGHALGLFMARARCAQMVLDGLPITKIKEENDRKRIRAILQKTIDESPAWARTLPIMILEGTGAVAPFILPPEETYANVEGAQEYMKKSFAKIDLARTLRMAENSVLSDLVRIQTQPYEKTKRTNPLQHVSTFYRTLVHVIVPSYYHTLSPLFAHLFAVSATTRLRGAFIGDFLRGTNAPALVSWSAHSIGHDEWMRDFNPWIMASLAQLPSSSWGVRDVPELQKRALPLSAMPLGATSSGTSPQMRALRTYSRPDRTVLNLSISGWKLAAVGPEKMAKAVNELEQMKRSGVILDYDIVSDVPLLRTGEVVQLILTLPVR